MFSYSVLVSSLDCELTSPLIDSPQVGFSENYPVTLGYGWPNSCY